MAAVGLASRQRGFLGILSLLAASQVLFHLLFSMTTTMCGMPAAGGMAKPSGMSGMAEPGGMSGMAGSAGMSEMCGGLDVVRMVAFHAIAAALSALVLAHGETVLFRLAAIWLRVLRRPPARLQCAPTTIGWSVRTSTRSVLPAGPALLRHPRRGQFGDHTQSRGPAERPSWALRRRAAAAKARQAPDSGSSVTRRKAAAA